MRGSAEAVLEREGDVAVHILQHCVPITVWTGLPPQDVDINYTIGGLPGTGQVDVTAGPGELAAPATLPTGSSGTMRLPQVTSISLHYKKQPGAPDSIEVEVSVTPAP